MKLCRWPGAPKPPHDIPRPAPRRWRTPTRHRRRGDLPAPRRRHAHHRWIGRRRRCLPWPRQPPHRRGHRPAGRHHGLRPHRHVQQPACRGPRAYRAGRRARRPDARLFLLVRLRRHRGCVEACPSVLRRDRPAPAHPLHRAASELSRQHARRARRRRQHDAARAVRADPGAGVQPGVAMFRLSFQTQRPDRPAVRRSSCRRTGGANSRCSAPNQ